MTRKPDPAGGCGLMLLSLLAAVVAGIVAIVYLVVQASYSDGGRLSRHLARLVQA